MLQRTADPLGLDRIRRLSREWRADSVVSRAVRLAWDAFALAHTDLSDWASAYRPSRQDERALRTYLDPGMGYAARSFVALHAIPSMRDKAAFAYALAFPDRRYGTGRHAGRWPRWRAAIGEVAASRRGNRRR